MARLADTSGRQRARVLGIVKHGPRHEPRRLYGLRRRRRTGCLHLTGGDGLQRAFDLPAVDLAGHELERDLDGLARFDVAGVVLRDFDADEVSRRP
jgi:hypothetical protein